ncbi:MULTISPECIES: helix-turn-helix domain-containing protein [Micromonospora]|uniref:helix-turn-helix domain-containing protein n=1 Tax=Micromonospora TaxID=1873 RepID=UPI001E284FB7|nr:helix-turn-helix transcriptional regulator [Micromonospora maris]
MARNDGLRQAMATAGLTAADLAERCEVDAKTVERWVSRGRVPHPRSRVRAAAVLGKDVGVLWPEIIRRAAKVGTDRELVGMYPRRADLPRAVFREAIERAQSRIWFGGYTSYFVWLEVPDAATTLAAKANAGADLRFLLGDPDSPITAERDRLEATPLTLATRIAMTRAEIGKVDAAVPVRLSDRHIAMSVWVFDDEAIVATHIGSGLGQDSVTLHLRRTQGGGVFDRYVEHFASLWADGKPADI